MKWHVRRRTRRDEAAAVSTPLPEEMHDWVLRYFAGSGFFRKGSGEVDALIGLFAPGQVLDGYRARTKENLVRRSTAIALGPFRLYFEDKSPEISDRITALLKADRSPVIERRAFRLPSLRTAIAAFDKAPTDERQERKLPMIEGGYLEYLHLVLLTILTTR